MIDGRVLDHRASLSAVAAGCLARAVVRQPRPLAERVSSPTRAGHRASARHGSTRRRRTTGRTEQSA